VRGADVPLGRPAERRCPHRFHCARTRTVDRSFTGCTVVSSCPQIGFGSLTGVVVVGNHSRSRGGSRMPLLAGDGPDSGGPVVSRRWFGRALVVGVPTAVVLAKQGKAEAAATGPWSVTGNAGTTPGTNFLGTTDSEAVVVKTANVERLRVASSGLVGIGTTAPAGQLNVVSTSQIAVRGDYTGTGSSAGVRGSTTSRSGAAAGVSGVLAPDGAPGTNGAGVLGTVTVKDATGVGVLGHHSGTGSGVFGYTDGAGTGVKGQSTGADGVGVLGTALSGATGGSFTSDTGTAVYASTSGTGTGYGVYAYGPGGGDGGAALYAEGSTQLVGDAEVYGDLTVLGSVSKPAGSFKIDHPLAPAEKYLWHSFVESPDMMNIYNGVVTLDATGSATVTMPTWFEPLNRDFRYQLTALGSPGPNLHISTEISNASFTIAGGSAGQKVSWQVTGVRQDAWANAHRIPVETDKPANLQGTYIHPELFGKTAAHSEHPPAQLATH
jgi:hypothetical protein